MLVIRSWKYRIYPSKNQEKMLNRHLEECKSLWNSLLEYAKKHYKETGQLPSRKELYLLAKGTVIFSQVAQNVADRLVKSLKGMSARKKAGRRAGFPRFKSMDRMKSFTYPQFGFELTDMLELCSIGRVSIKKHRKINGKIKTLTIKKSPSEKWFAVFVTETEVEAPKEKDGPQVGIDLGIENFGYLSDGDMIENPRYLKRVEGKLKKVHRQLSRKRKGSGNRRKARLRAAIAHEKLTNQRRDFLHRISRKLAKKYSFIAMESLDTAGLARGFLAKQILDCSWAEFSSMLRYKAAEAGCKVVLVEPAHTTQMCSSCGLVREKSLAERWHYCPCGASMHRDLNAAINILNRAIANSQERVQQSESTSDSATLGTRECQACGEGTSTHYKYNGHVSSMKHEVHDLNRG